MIHLFELFTVGASWLRYGARRAALSDALASRLDSLARNAKARTWAESLQTVHGRLVALKPVTILSGLPEFPNAGFFWRLLDTGTPAEIVVAENCLLFCTPGFKPGCGLHVLPRDRIVKAGTDWYNGSMLIIRTDDAKITCDTGGKLDAKPIADIIARR